MTEVERAELVLRIQRALRDLRVHVEAELGTILQDLARLSQDEKH